jgi:hypothetical protein
MSNASLRVYIGAIQSVVNATTSVTCLGILFIAALVLAGRHIVERTTEAEAAVLVLAAMGIWQGRGWAIAALNLLMPPTPTSPSTER